MQQRPHSRHSHSNFGKVRHFRAPERQSRWLRRHGVRQPGHSPPLTTVHQPCQRIAISAFRAMMDRLVEPSLPARAISLTPHLVVRESRGAYTA
ncbi:substrate-binding domain-containing protein [Roseibacillus ishigakijimensis]|uniref:Substrate-binding domain-containing protein n=1 Tax=Roseibacillus ishigakijimensis TaxID=454146 RepID=A0A934RML7_9BACT|nr:substrate-binding domain-containing protein [Roseibacillus ishigakijimensis]